METVTKEDLKATSSMILKKEYPNAKYHFADDVLVWEDTDTTKPTDAWIAAKIKAHDEALP
tara:strand:- start:814 stop:996 length:183 start_codon:yes stop_codon:yes gene_type:complete